MSGGDRPLAARQAGLLGLLQGEPVGRHDPYLTLVAASPSLEVLRDIAAWWRVYGIEQVCPLTTAALRARGSFDDIVAAFCRRPGLPRLFEPLGELFLEDQARGTDPVVASVARFEAAVRATIAGRPGEQLISWDREPESLLRALLTSGDVEACPRGDYLTRVAPGLPALFEVVPAAGRVDGSAR